MTSIKARKVIKIKRKSPVKSVKSVTRGIKSKSSSLKKSRKPKKSVIKSGSKSSKHKTRKSPKSKSSSKRSNKKSPVKSSLKTIFYHVTNLKDKDRNSFDKYFKSLPKRTQEKGLIEVSLKYHWETKPTLANAERYIKHLERNANMRCIGL